MLQPAPEPVDQSQQYASPKNRCVANFTDLKKRKEKNRGDSALCKIPLWRSRSDAVLRTSTASIGACEEITVPCGTCTSRAPVGVVARRRVFLGTHIRTPRERNVRSAG